MDAKQRLPIELTRGKSQNYYCQLGKALVVLMLILPQGRIAGEMLAVAPLPDAATKLTESPEMVSSARSEIPAGKLVICGGGQLPDQVLQRFIELAGGTQARIVVVPTASQLADSPAVEKMLAFWRQQSVASLAVLHTRSRTTADDPRFFEPLRTATGVWFTGGNQNHVTETYLGTAAEAEIRNVLARNGVVGGTSAGAAIMSAVMIRGGETHPQVGRGFGFLPGVVIDQHFLKRNRQERLLSVLAQHPGLVGVGIDEGTALVVDGGRVSVLGDSQVVTYTASQGNQPAQVERSSSGAEIKLAQLQKRAAR